MGGKKKQKCEKLGCYSEKCQQRQKVHIWMVRDGRTRERVLRGDGEKTWRIVMINISMTTVYSNDINIWTYKLYILNYIAYICYFDISTLSQKLLLLVYNIILYTICVLYSKNSYWSGNASQRYWKSNSEALGSVYRVSN